MRLLKQLTAVFFVLGLLLGGLALLSHDVIKLNWIVFMEVQSSYQAMEHPVPLPARSIPIEGPAYIPNIGAPENPVSADAVSIARGAEFFNINCALCHGPKGLGNGKVAAWVLNPANLTLPVVQNKSDGALFLTITFGVNGRMPALNENLLVRDRWDVVNFLRTLAAPQ